MRSSIPDPDSIQQFRLHRNSRLQPHSHHVATEKVEEFTPFCAAVWSNRALPTPSGLSEHDLYHKVTWDEKQRADDAHNTNASHTGMDHVLLRRRRSRLGAASFLKRERPHQRRQRKAAPPKGAGGRSERGNKEEREKFPLFLRGVFRVVQWMVLLCPSLLLVVLPSSPSFGLSLDVHCWTHH